ncbi:Bromodomain-containing protein, partial [Martensiomyces pterosporus]
FLEPVDTSVITDYLTVITTPMDLGTMQRKVESGSYMSIEEFKQDLLLVCANARKYNGAGSIYAKSADRVQE